MIVYSIDIGGSSIKQSLIELYDTSPPVLERLKKVRHKANTFNALKKTVLGIIGDAISKHGEFKIISICTTGGVDQHGVVVNSGFIDGYSNVCWSSIIKDHYTSIDLVFVINDGKASTWAEYLSCVDTPSVFSHFVLGTGIGGSSVINDELVFGSSGMAGYFGHILVPTFKINSDDKQADKVQNLASGTAITRHYSDLKPLKNESIKLQDVIDLCANGDPIAQQAVISAANRLGIAMGNVMNILNPSIITIGGGVTLALGKLFHNLFLPEVKRSAQISAHRNLIDTQIRPAKLGNDAGMIGAAAKARSDFLKQLPLK